MSRLRGLKALVHDTVDFTTDMVAEGHESVARNALRVIDLIAPGSAPARRVDGLRRLATSGVLGAVRAVNHLVASLTDAGLDAAEAVGLLSAAQAPPAPIPMRSDITDTGAWIADAALGALNGIAGDRLRRDGNGLDLGLSLRVNDTYVALDPPQGAPPVLALPQGHPGIEARRVALFIHGLATTEWSWCWNAAAYHGDAAAHFGTLLQRDLGWTPVFARYNTGRRVCENGRALSDGLERIFAARPDAIQDLVLIGHSMGGLVARSACHHASRAGYRWVRSVSRVLCLGTPHQGAPLEKLGHVLTSVLGAIDHPGTRIPAEILRRRSAGIQDLRHGTPLEDRLPGMADEAAPPIPLLDHITYHFLSATVTRDREHPLGRLIGDVLVRIPSASGPIVQERALRIETACFGGVLHHQLQNHPDVYAWIKGAL